MVQEVEDGVEEVGDGVEEVEEGRWGRGSGRRGRGQDGDGVEVVEMEMNKPIRVQVFVLLIAVR